MSDFVSAVYLMYCVNKLREMNMLEEITPEISKDLVSKVYDNVVHPALKVTGELLGLLPRAILAKLTPLRIWVLNAEIQFQKTAKLLVKKLENVLP